MWWQSMDMQKSFSRTYNEGSSTCPIEIHADKVIVEQMEGKISRILDKIDIKEGTLEISYVHELFEHDAFLNTMRFIMMAPQLSWQWSSALPLLHVPPILRHNWASDLQDLWEWQLQRLRQAQQLWRRQRALIPLRC
jgi:hypothetical protein